MPVFVVALPSLMLLVVLLPLLPRDGNEKLLVKLCNALKREVVVVPMTANLERDPETRLCEKRNDWSSEIIGIQNRIDRDEIGAYVGERSYHGFGMQRAYNIKRK